VFIEEICLRECARGALWFNAANEFPVSREIGKWPIGRQTPPIAARRRNGREFPVLFAGKLLKSTRAKAISGEINPYFPPHVAPNN
jgi:hypothetical protein